MIHHRLKEQGLLPTTLLLGFMSISCFMLSLSRIQLTGSPMYIFLNWNLFLAFIPWLFSTWVLVDDKLRKSKIAILILSAAWLAFFPNALYILTDLFHLHKGTAAPLWFDLVLILTFAWTGLMFGFLSLFNMEKLLSPYINKNHITTLSIIMLFGAAFGVYLGRYLRWNSWDVLQNPIGLISDIGDRIINPFAHPRTWGVTVFMGMFLCMVYFSIKLLFYKNNLKENTLPA